MLRCCSCNRGLGSGGSGALAPTLFGGGDQSMCGPPLFKATQVFQFKLRSHMFMYWKVWTMYMSDKIWFLKKEGSEAAYRSTDCSYWTIVSPVFTVNLRHKFAWSIALSKCTCSKSQIRHQTTFRLSFWHLYNDGNWPLGFLPLHYAARHTHTEIGTSPPHYFYCRSDACAFQLWPELD